MAELSLAKDKYKYSSAIICGQLTRIIFLSCSHVLLPGVAIASNPVFSTALTEVPHWSLQGLGKSNGGQSLCFDRPNSGSLDGLLIAWLHNVRANLVFTHTSGQVCAV